MNMKNEQSTHSIVHTDSINSSFTNLVKNTIVSSQNPNVETKNAPELNFKNAK